MELYFSEGKLLEFHIKVRNITRLTTWQHTKIEAYKTWRPCPTGYT